MYLKRLQETREDNDNTQAQTAMKLGMRQQQYQLYESGKRNIPIDKLFLFCVLYNVSADYILELPSNLNHPR